MDEQEPKNEKDLNHIIVKQNISPTFKNIKSTLYNYINKNPPKDIENLEELPNQSEYYKTISGDDYLIYKTEKLLFL